ncbi:hypothetical protein EB796_025312 [Bugula neritina]|uniref:Uncharacterized protein n=1 Tax=Bugula neritina TaxID=10212 RepID=A0A7J7IR21_BUGNE|nr:hypothetical protein EB796_025312 [Bugula neritina]
MNMIAFIFISLKKQILFLYSIPEIVCDPIVMENRRPSRAPGSGRPSSRFNPITSRSAQPNLYCQLGYS